MHFTGDPDSGARADGRVGQYLRAVLTDLLQVRGDRSTRLIAGSIENRYKFRAEMTKVMNGFIAVVHAVGNANYLPTVTATDADE